MFTFKYNKKNIKMTKYCLSKGLKNGRYLPVR